MTKALKQLRASRKAAKAPILAAVKRGQERRAKMRLCPYCGERFPNADSIRSHLERSSCLKRAEARERRARGRDRNHKRLVDPP